jgi:hypothetical protein
MAAAAARAVSSLQQCSSLKGRTSLGASRSEYAGLATSLADLSISRPAAPPARTYVAPVASKCKSLPLPLCIFECRAELNRMWG